MAAKPLSNMALSTCPHDCPSVCCLEVEIVDEHHIGRVHGASSNTYTAGVVCAKVARYAERAHHPERLMKPLQRTGAKGAGEWREVGWDDALDEVAEALLKAERDHGAESVWPYRYAGTMGLVQRDGLMRLTHAKGYSRQHDSICTNMAFTGYMAGTGKLAGVDPREMADADVVVIWGTNPVHTQVNVMTHATRARSRRGAKIVAVDIYNNATMKQADLALCLKPGTDAALACATMHVLFRDGYADWDYLEKYTDRPKDLEAHLATRTPEWAADITGLSVEKIEEFAHLVGRNKRTFFRLGYGFTRQRNGSIAMHAASCIPAVTGAWLHKGGGAFHNNGDIYRLNKKMITGLDRYDLSARYLDQSRIGPILTGDPDALMGGGPVHAMLIQNTNPVSVAPDQNKVVAGFARDDLFVCVHEQFMTETAKMADIVLPATMFVEHDDIYQAGGHQHIQLGLKVIDGPKTCRTNHFVHCEIAKRVGAEHPGFQMTEREHIDWMLTESGYGSLAELQQTNWRDLQPDFDTSHFVDGFGWPDGKFRFSPDWETVRANNRPVDGRTFGPAAEAPEFPDHWRVIEEADENHPFRMATSPSRSFLNSSFNNTPSSLKREAEPSVMIRPEDAAEYGIEDGQMVRIGNSRGETLVKARFFDGLVRGVLICEGVWANDRHEGGKGINVLTGADPVAPYGGAAFHDNHVWIKPA